MSTTTLIVIGSAIVLLLLAVLVRLPRRADAPAPDGIAYPLRVGDVVLLQTNRYAYDPGALAYREERYAVETTVVAAEWSGAWLSWEDGRCLVLVPWSAWSTSPHWSVVTHFQPHPLTGATVWHREGR